MSARRAPRIPADTIARQRQASDPATSAWVSANAGSGKTHVLAQRVLRLLLAGVPPGRILCLTFTKAAAANMSIRVFDELAAWTRLEDAPLAAAIARTGAPVPSPALGGLDAARRLFARTVETPGGLKIQTIHAFCERLLHLFPFEANVPARFEVLDERDADDLLLRARTLVLGGALRDGTSDLGLALSLLSGLLGPAGFEERISEALGHRHRLREALRGARGLDALLARMRRALGLAPGETPAAIAAEIRTGGVPLVDWAEVARRIGADGGGPAKAGNRLMAAAEAPEGEQAEAYLSVFLTEKREPRSDRYLPAALRKAEPALCDRLDRERERLVALLERLRAAETAERSAALLSVAGAVLAAYDTAKQRRGLLDFDDLVERTLNLLSTSSSAWVLFKLDRGIDHVLVDEAQDTSPEQWDILRAVTADFFSGAGASEQNRTVFAVGDEKQSIYSFQGARPDSFAAMRDHFARRIREAERGFADVSLLLSFRSSPAILEAVDRVFAHPANARGLVHDGAAGPAPHVALKSTVPGLVEIWPPVLSRPAPEPTDWRLPVDVIEAGDPPVVLARRVAEAIRRLIDPASGETVAEDDGRRPIRPGDVMVLVRSRNALFEAVIRALKERNVPVAGADRLTLTEHIAVMDLIAAGRAALSPADDFTLACVLKSPLLGLDDDDLIALAPGRTGTLVAALGASDRPTHVAARDRLEAWRARSAFLTPFAFYTRLLGADGGRRALLARLGTEANDAIDEFLALTLAHERNGAPSLMAFLARLEGAHVDIKRDLEAAGHAVRVMTVHAAKGLEAKIVFLPDTAAVTNGRHDPALFGLAEGPESEEVLLAWSPRAETDPPSVAAARAVVRERAREEHNRLLYVAMTRAEERLYVASFAGEKGPGDGSWYAMIEAAGLPLVSHPAFWNPEESVLRLADPMGAAARVIGEALASGPLGFVPPPWLFAPVRGGDIAVAPPVRPSNPLGAADQVAPPGWPYEGRRDGRRRAAAATGRLLHRLLQHLPELPAERRPAAAARFLLAQGAGLSESERQELTERALAVIGSPALATLFGPGSRAEVAVAGTALLPGGRAVPVTGQIDRLAVEAGRVLIADFKSGSPGPLDPRHILQLALYRAVVMRLYPDRTIDTVVIWTATAEAVPVSEEACREALARL